eukprot:COSAG01_NODE_1460_length_10242_cov_285.193631_8_plen_110_part_00
MPATLASLRSSTARAACVASRWTLRARPAVRARVAATPPFVHAFSDSARRTAGGTVPPLASQLVTAEASREWRGGEGGGGSMVVLHLAGGPERGTSARSSRRCVSSQNA